MLVYLWCVGVYSLFVCSFVCIDLGLALGIGVGIALGVLWKKTTNQRKSRIPNTETNILFGVFKLFSLFFVFCFFLFVCIGIGLATGFGIGKGPLKIYKIATCQQII